MNPDYNEYEYDPTEEERIIYDPEEMYISVRGRNKKEQDRNQDLDLTLLLAEDEDDYEYWRRRRRDEDEDSELRFSLDENVEYERITTGYLDGKCHRNCGNPNCHNECHETTTCDVCIELDKFKTIQEAQRNSRRRY